MWIVLLFIFLFGAATALVFYRALGVPDLTPRDVFYRLLTGFCLLIIAAALLFFGYLGYAQLRYGPVY